MSLKVEVFYFDFDFFLFLVLARISFKVLGSVYNCSACSIICGFCLFPEKMFDGKKKKKWK